MLGSYRLLRQIAHVSVQIAQDHIATAFHFLISNRLPNFSLPCTAQPDLQPLRPLLAFMHSMSHWRSPSFCHCLPVALPLPWLLLRQPWRHQQGARQVPTSSRYRSEFGVSSTTFDVCTSIQFRVTASSSYINRRVPDTFMQVSEVFCRRNTRARISSKEIKQQNGSIW